MMRSNMLVDTVMLEVIKKMEKEKGYDFIVGLLEYGLYGKEPQFNELALQLAFIPIKCKVDYNIQRYENCVRNGEKGKEYGVQGAEYGKLGGRPRRGETKEEYVERKKKENDTLPNCQITLKESEREKWAETVKDNFKKKSEIQTPVPVQETPIPDAPEDDNDLEAEFRKKLAEGDNRKWITDYSSYNKALIQNREFTEWIKDYDRTDIESIWERLRRNYLENLKKELDVSDGTNKEIYDWLKEKMITRFITSGFNVTCVHNQANINGWMQDNGYDRNTVEIIFDKVWREVQELKNKY